MKLTMKQLNEFSQDYFKLISNPKHSSYRIGQHFCNYFLIRADTDANESKLWEMSDMEEFWDFVTDNYLGE